MASFGRNGNLEKFRDKLIQGMLDRGYERLFAERLFEQIKGFGNYGFPESHAASFALLVYVSAWLKCHHPEAFYAALLNSQPMGFYSPSQLVQDARRHGVRVLPVCAVESDWEHTVKRDQDGLVLRLGLMLVKGLSEASVRRLVNARLQQPLRGVQDVRQRKLLAQDELVKLVNANGFQIFESNRRRVYWNALRNDDGFNHEVVSDASFIGELSDFDALVADYQHARGVSLNYHPMQLLRSLLPFSRCVRAQEILSRPNNSRIDVAGVVTGRQRPGTASGVMFVTLEDETGNINVVLWRGVQERFRAAVLNSRLMYVRGQLEHQNGVAHVIAAFVENQDSALPKMGARSRDFH